MDYYPDKWVVIKITPKSGEVCYKVFATWLASYLGSESWKLNSGITKCEFSSEDTMYEFHGHSGSVYYCHKRSYGTSSWTMGVLSTFIQRSEAAGNKIEILPEDIDWLNMNWIA